MSEMATGSTKSKLLARRLGAMLVVSALGLLATGCSFGAQDPSAPYFPTVAQAAAHPDPLNLGTGSLIAHASILRGAISRPNLSLTPGVIADHDVTSVCKSPRHVKVPVPIPEAQAIKAAYGIPANRYPRYYMDYLVPLNLGGAAVQANLWPMSTKGVGFHEKANLNARLRNVVCDGRMTLDQAQHAIITDWYTLWVRYGA